MTITLRRFHVWRAMCPLTRFDYYVYRNETGRINCFAFTVLGHHVRYYPTRARR